MQPRLGCLVVVRVLVQPRAVPPCGVEATATSPRLGLLSSVLVNSNHIQGYCTQDSVLFTVAPSNPYLQQASTEA